jgi:hypothetical protein
MTLRYDVALACDGTLSWRPVPAPPVEPPESASVPATDPAWPRKANTDCPPTTGKVPETVAPKPPVASHEPMRAEPGQPSENIGFTVVIVPTGVIAAPPGDSAKVNAVADGVVRTKYGTPVTAVVQPIPDDVKQIWLPIVKGCAAAIVIVLVA